MAYAVSSQQADTENNVLAISNAKIPLAQAIAAAEQQTGGKATHAEFEHEQDRWLADVEVVKGGEVFGAIIDAERGTIHSSKEGKAGHHEHDD